MITYELALKLKESGFPQTGNGITPQAWICNQDHSKKELLAVYIPTLSELIKACGEELEDLRRDGHGWVAINGLNWERKFDKDMTLYESGSSPEEAVANLWLALNKK